MNGNPDTNTYEPIHIHCIGQIIVAVVSVAGFILTDFIYILVRRGCKPSKIDE